MKGFKKCALFAALLAAGIFAGTNRAYALPENTALTFGLWDISFIGGSSFDGADFYEGQMSFLNIGVEDHKESGGTGLGFSFNPVTMFYSVEKEPSFSFLNVHAYWNVFNHYFDGGLFSYDFFLGPFAAVNYAFFDNGFDWKKNVFTAGVQMGFRAIPFEEFISNMISVEAGCRFVDGNGGYYITLKIDTLGLVVPIGAAGVYIFFSALF